MKTLAHMDHRTQSAMCAELIQIAMRQPEIQLKLKEAEERGILVKRQPDRRRAQPQRWFVD